jgi:hypothetical protein
MRIRAIVTLALLFIIPALAVKGQDQPGAVFTDTAHANKIILLDPGLALGRATFLFPQSVGTGLSFRDPAMMFAGSGFSGAGPFNGGILEPRADLMSPLRLQWASQKNLNYFQMVLSAVETGAVGYMAYRHVRKYGLFR